MLVPRRSRTCHQFAESGAGDGGASGTGEGGTRAGAAREARAEECAEAGLPREESRSLQSAFPRGSGGVRRRFLYHIHLLYYVTAVAQQSKRGRSATPSHITIGGWNTTLNIERRIEIRCALRASAAATRVSSPDPPKSISFLLQRKPQRHPASRPSPTTGKLYPAPSQYRRYEQSLEAGAEEWQPAAEVRPCRRQRAVRWRHKFRR